MLDNFNFYKSTALTKYSEYHPNRINFDLALIYYLIKFFQPQNILEIGVHQGLTFGLMFEASSENCSMTGVDLPEQNLFAELFNKHYNASEKNVNFFKMNSDNFVSDQCYDFINVDGDHDMPRQYTDIVKATSMLSNNGILMVDDIDMPGVDEAIGVFLNSQSEVVPFLITMQTVFFHKPQYHQAGEFLDALITKFTDFCQFEEYNYKSHYVSRVSCIPAIIKHTDVFKLICEKYSI